MPQYLQDPAENIAENIAAFGSNSTNTKVDNLQQRAQDKINKLSGDRLSTYSDAILKYTGDDGDGFTTIDPTTGKESTYRTAGIDAVETLHGNRPYDMYGVEPSLKRNQPEKYKYSKSALSMDAQRQGVADVINQNNPNAHKTAANITEQDMLDVANMNKIQQLADIVNGNSDWEAPYIPGARTDLSKNAYSGGNGMNIPVKVKGVQKSNMSRELGYLANKEGVDINAVMHNDNQVNTGGRFAYEDSFGNKGEIQPVDNGEALLAALNKAKFGDQGFLEGVAKGTASTVTSTIGQAIDAVANDAPDWLIGKAEEAYYDHQIANATSKEERAKLEAEKKDAIAHSFKMNGVASWLGGDGYNDTKEYYTNENIGQMADATYGVNTDQAQREQAQVEDDIKKGNYGMAAWHAMRSGNIVGNVVGSVGTFMIGAGEAKAGMMVVKNGSKIGKAYEKAAQLMKAGKVVQAEKLTAAANNKLNMAQKVLAKGIERAGATAMFTGIANDTLAARNEAEGQKHTGGEDIALASISAALQTYIGLESAMVITKPIKVALKDSVSVLGKKATDKLWHSVLKSAGRMAAAGGKGMAVEGTEEYLQQWADILGKQWDTGKKGDDLQSIIANEKNQLDAKVAGIEGLAGGHIAGATQGVAELSNAVNSLKSKLPKGSKPVEAKVTTDEELAASRDAANRAMTNVPTFQSIASKVDDPKNVKVKDAMKKVILNGSSDGKPGLNKNIDDLMTHLTTLDSLDSTPEIITEKELVTKHLQDALNLRRKLNGESEILGNRDPKEIAKDMAEVQTELADITDETVKSEKVKELAKLKAEKLVSDLVHSKDFNGVTVVDKANKNESLALKLLGGEYKGKRKLGMLEHLDAVINAQSDTARDSAIIAMNKFMSTQAEKRDAFKAAQRVYKEKADNLRETIKNLEAIGKDAAGLDKAKNDLAKLKVDVNYPGSKYVYDGKKSEGFTAKLEKEYKLLQDINSLATDTINGTLEVGKPQQAETTQQKVEEAAPVVEGAVKEKNANVQTATVAGIPIRYYSADASNGQLAGTSSDGSKIRLSKNITAKKVLDYLSTHREFKDEKSKEVILTKQQVTDSINKDYSIDFLDTISKLSPQDIRKFLLLHEYRHTQQIGKYGKEEFRKKYTADPALYEKDANVFALKKLGLLNKGKIDAKQNEETKVVTEEKSTTTGTEQSTGQGNTESTKPKQEELTGIDKEIANLEVEIKELEKEVYEKQNTLDKLTDGYNFKNTKRHILRNAIQTRMWTAKQLEKSNASIKRINSYIASIDSSVDALYNKLAETTNKKVESSIQQAIDKKVAKKDELEYKKDFIKDQTQGKERKLTETRKKTIKRILQMQEVNNKVKDTKAAIKEKKSELIDKTAERDNKVASSILAWTADNKSHHVTEAKNGVDVAYGKGYLHEFFKAATEPKNLNATALDVLRELLAQKKETLSSVAQKNLLTAGVTIKKLTGSVQSVVENDLSSARANMVWFGTDSVEGFQSVSRMLMAYTVPEGEFANKGKLELNGKVAEALATSAVEVLTDSMAKFDSERRDNNAVRALKGMDKNAPVSQTDRMSIKDFDGIMDYVSSTIGNKAWKALGLKAVKDAPEGLDTEYIEQKLKAELGMLGMLALEKAEYIILNAKDRDIKLKKEMVFKKGYKTPAAMIYENDKDAGKPDIVTYNLTTTAKDLIKAHKGMTTDLEKVLEPTEDSLGIYTEDNKHEMEDTPTEHQSVSKLFSVSEPRVKAVKKQSDTRLTIGEDFMTGLDKLDGIADTTGYDENGEDVPYSLLDKILGKVDPDTIYVNEREGAKGKNDAIDRQKKLLDEVYEATDKGKKPFWQKWRILTNFRFGIIGGKFDHQSILLHRFATDMGKAEVKLGSTEEKILKLAIGQALGVDVDKLPMGKSIKQYAGLEAKVNGVFGDAKIPTIQDITNDDLKELVDVLGVHDEHGIKGMIEILKYMNHKESASDEAYMSTIMLETDAVTSGYILKMLQMPIFVKGGKLDMKKTFEELERGGFMRVKDGHVPKYSEIADDKTKRDAYQEPAELFRQKVENAKKVNINVKGEIKGVVLDNSKGLAELKFVDPVPSFIGKPVPHPALVKGTQAEIEKRAKGILQGMEVAMELLGEGTRDGEEHLIEEISRAFMKHPFMVLNYGSGMKGIINSIAKRALSTSGTPYPSKSNLNALMTTMATSKKVSEVEGAFDLMKRALKASSYLMVDPSTGKKMYYDKQSEAVDAWLGKLRAELDKTPMNVLNMKIPDNFYEMVQEHVARVVGKPIRDTFEEQYGELIKATRTTNSTIALIGKIALEEVNKQIDIETKKKNEGKHKSKWVPLTTKEVDAILKANKVILPIINMALDNGNGDQMVLFKTAKGDWTEGTMNTAINLQGKIERANGDKLRANSELYKMVVAFTSGAVMPIHAQDASIQAEVLAKWEALGVHDANFATVDKAMGVTKSYNKSAYHLSKDWSLTTEMLDSLYATLNGVDKEVIQKVEDDTAMESVLNVVRKMLTNPVSDIYDMIQGEAPTALDGLSYAEQKELVVEIGKNQNEVLAAVKTFLSKLDGDLSDAYNEYLNTVSEMDMSDNARIAMMSVGRMRDITHLPTMRSTVKEMEQLQKRAEEGRKVLFETDFSVGHSALDGAEYRAEGKEEYVPKVPKNKLDKSKLPKELVYENHSVEPDEVVDTPLANRPLQEVKAETNPEMDIIANKILDQLECD